MGLIILFVVLITGSSWNWPKAGQTHAAKSNILVSSKIGTYSNENSYFLPNIIRIYLMNVYHSTYFFLTFFNRGNYKIRTLSWSSSAKRSIKIGTISFSSLLPYLFLILLFTKDAVTIKNIFASPCTNDNNFLTASFNSSSIKI